MYPSKPRQRGIGDDLMPLAREIFGYIKEKRIKRHELSVELGLSPSMVTKWMNFQNRPTRKNFTKLVAWYEGHQSKPSPSEST